MGDTITHTQGLVNTNAHTWVGGYKHTYPWLWDTNTYNKDFGIQSHISKVPGIQNTYSRLEGYKDTYPRFDRYRHTCTRVGEYKHVAMALRYKYIYQRLGGQTNISKAWDIETNVPKAMK